MKNIILLLISLQLLSFSEKEASQSNSKSLTDINQGQDEKEFLLNYYTESQQLLLENVQGLSEAQMNYKPSEEEWSINEILEHVILTEKALFNSSQELLLLAANPERKEEIKMSDQDFLDGMTNRNSKFKTTPELEPSGVYNNSEDALREFRAQRDEITRFISNSSQELRDYISDSPFGPMDSYQTFLFIAGHTNRHVQQIEEVKTTPGFPSA